MHSIHTHFEFRIDRLGSRVSLSVVFCTLYSLIAYLRVIRIFSVFIIGRLRYHVRSNCCRYLYFFYRCYQVSKLPFISIKSTLVIAVTYSHVVHSHFESVLLRLNTEREFFFLSHALPMFDCPDICISYRFESRSILTSNLASLNIARFHCLDSLVPFGKRRMLQYVFNSRRVLVLLTLEKSHFLSIILDHLMCYNCPLFSLDY